MQQTFKAKVTNLLQEKLEGQGVSDESSDTRTNFSIFYSVKHSYELFDFLLSETFGRTFRFFTQNKQ